MSHDFNYIVKDPPYESLTMVTIDLFSIPMAKMTKDFNPR